MGHKTSPSFRESVYAANEYKMGFVWEHDIKKRRKLAFADSGVKDPSIYEVLAGSSCLELDARRLGPASAIEVNF